MKKWEFLFLIFLFVLFLQIETAASAKEALIFEDESLLITCFRKENLRALFVDVSIDEIEKAIVGNNITLESGKEWAYKELGFAKRDEVNKNVMDMAAKAYNNYKTDGSIKPLADLVAYMQENEGDLPIQLRLKLKKMIEDVGLQQETQISFKQADSDRPKVRGVEDFIAQMCAGILKDQSFEPTYLCNLKPDEFNSTQRGKELDTSKNMPVSYVVNGLKQMYLEAWKYPKDGRSGYYGEISCTGVLGKIAKSFYAQDKQVSTVVTYLYHNSKELSKTLGLELNKNHLPVYEKGSEIPIGAGVFSRPNNGKKNPSHVGIAMGEMITYDLQYIEHGAIQSAVDKGLSIVDLDQGIVYYARNYEPRRTTLYSYGYLPKVDYDFSNRVTK